MSAKRLSAPNMTSSDMCGIKLKCVLNATWLRRGYNVKRCNTHMQALNST